MDEEGEGTYCWYGEWWRGKLWVWDRHGVNFLFVLRWTLFHVLACSPVFGPVVMLYASFWVLMGSWESVVAAVGGARCFEIVLIVVCFNGAQMQSYLLEVNHISV